MSDPSFCGEGSESELTRTATEMADISLFEEDKKATIPTELLKLLRQQTSLFQSLGSVAHSCFAGTPLTPAAAKARRKHVERLWESCQQIHVQILTSKHHDAVTLLPYTLDNIFLTQELQYVELMGRLEDFIQPVAVAASTPPGVSSAAPTDSTRHLTQVPRIWMPSFSGTYQDWPSFRDYFHSLFIADKSFDDLQRFHYLKSCLEGEAAVSVKNLPVTSGSFSIAWEALKSRYENKRRLLSTLLDSLFATPVVYTESAANLRRLVNTVTEILQSRYGVSNDSVSSHLSSGVRHHQVILATAWIHVHGSFGRVAKVRALLDQGSTNTLITKELSDSLCLHTTKTAATLSGIGGVAAGKVSRIASVIIEPSEGRRPRLPTDALILPSLTSYTPKLKFPIESWSHLQGLPLADPNPQFNHPIHVIIGADLYAHVLLDGRRYGDLNQPVAQRTIFGWIISGQASNPSVLDSIRLHAHFLDVRESLDDVMTRFWAVENGGGEGKSVQEKRCEEHFANTVSRDANGRYIVRVPFKSSDSLSVGRSRERADKLLLSLERRLARDDNIRKLYLDCIRDYETNGHMRVVSDLREDHEGHYLSHHPVFKMSSDTTKLRVVFNASAPTHNRDSLNSLQWVGPKLQTDLSILIARWRAYRYVCCADLEQMYRQIWVHDDDARYQRIRWLYSVTEGIRSYQLHTVTFGTASAPFLAQRVLKQLVIDEGNQFPLAAPVVESNFYIDDCLFGTDDISLARQTITQLIDLLHKGGFNLRKWASNAEATLTDIDSHNHGLALEKSMSPDTSLKILGLEWSPVLDSFQPRVDISEMNSVTKRIVLSTIARLYDPLGWLGPVIIVAKIFMQNLWILQCDWDEELDVTLRVSWLDYYKSLPELQSLNISRWTGQGPDIIESSLHGFADASTKAYAAVIYLRTVSFLGDIRVTLLRGRTRVAPIRHQSVARLELCAAELLANTFSSLSDTAEYSALSRYCWTDSTIVLHWILKPTSRDVFVANRVSKIHSMIPEVPWRHVGSADNPADLSSRGMSSGELISCKLWWNGPTWLSNTENEWPCNPSSVLLDSSESEISVAHVFYTSSSPDLEFLRRFSSWDRLLRVIVRIMRWSHNYNQNYRGSGCVSASEIRHASERILTLLQNLQFANEISCLRNGESIAKHSVLLSLDPFIDARGLLRVGGRLRHSTCSEDTRHPIILKAYFITTLLISRAHERSLH